MKYKISQVVKMTGIPAETIRYYESEGIVRPTRVNTYRYYSELDVLNLLEYRKMRNYGMNMAQIKDFFKIDDMGSYVQEFERLAEKYEEAVRFYQVLHEYAVQSIDTMSGAGDEVGKFHLVTMPEKYYINFYFNKENGSDKNAEIWQCWINKYYSLVEYLSIFQYENFILDVPKNECLWVNALDRKKVEELDIPLPENVAVIPSQQAIYTVAEMTGEEFFDLDVINNIKKYLKENNYRISGNVIGKMLSRIHSVEHRYMGIWIPVEL